MNMEELKKIRIKLGLSKEAFGHLLGVTLSTVTRWESGAFKPSKLAAEKINQLLKDKG